MTLWSAGKRVGVASPILASTNITGTLRRNSPGPSYQDSALSNLACPLATLTWCAPWYAVLVALARCLSAALFSAAPRSRKLSPGSTLVCLPVHQRTMPLRQQECHDRNTAIGYKRQSV